MNKTKLIALIGLAAGIAASGVAFGMNNKQRKTPLKKRPELRENSPNRRKRPRPEGEDTQPKKRQRTKTFIEKSPGKFHQIGEGAIELKGPYFKIEHDEFVEESDPNNVLILRYVSKHKEQD